MFTYLDIIALTIGGCLLLGFIIRIRGNIDGGPIGVLMLSTISLIFFAPAIIYALNLPASAHDLKNLTHLCPSIEYEIDLLNAPVTERELTKFYNDCKPD
jgi:hypothetical protein